MMAPGAILFRFIRFINLSIEYFLLFFQKLKLQFAKLMETEEDDDDDDDDV